MAEGKFLDVETHAHDGHRPIRGEAAAANPRRGHERANDAFRQEFKNYFEKFGQIYKTAVGQFGALAVEGCTLAKGTKLDLKNHLHVQRY